MAIVRWQPFGISPTFDKMRQRLNKMLYSDFFDFFDEETEMVQWKPVVDIKETDSAIIINAEVPGIKESDIDIKLEDNVLTLKGKRESNSEEKNEKYHKVERFYGEFYRSFNIPTNIDAEKIEAKLKDGVLSINLPKTESAKPKQIKISNE